MIGSTPIVKNYQDLTNITKNTVGLNDNVSINIDIDKKWDWMPVNPCWELQSEEQWLLFDKSEGQEPGTVQITLLTPDFQFSPGKRDVHFSLINTKLDFIDFVELKFFADVMTIKLNVTEEKKKPDLVIKVDPPELDSATLDQQIFTITIKNEGDGVPWWTLRSDKNWIELWNNTEKGERYDSNKRRSDDGDVYFKINIPNIEEINKIMEGNITLGYNNDGKDMIHIFVCRNKTGDTLKINSTIENWYLPDYYDNKTELRRPETPADWKSECRLYNNSQSHSK